MTRVGADADPADLERLAVRAASAAAKMLGDAVGETRLRVETKSTGTDMVTEMDQAAEQLLVELLLDARPHDAVLGEEGTDRRGTSDVRWIIDPLDGTTNYLYRYPGYNVSVAAEVAGEVIAGAVVDPTHARTFAATRGAGATCNGAPIQANQEVELATALVATGFSYSPPRRRAQAQALATVLPRVRDIRRMGAAALDLCWVASGVVDVFFEAGLAPWDHAAGGLIASEAGCVVGDLWGGPASQQFTLAAPPALFGPMRDLLLEAGADSS